MGMPIRSFLPRLALVSCCFVRVTATTTISARSCFQHPTCVFLHGIQQRSALGNLYHTSSSSSWTSSSCWSWWWSFPRNNFVFIGGEKKKNGNYNNDLKIRLGTRLLNMKNIDPSDFIVMNQHHEESGADDKHDNNNDNDNDDDDTNKRNKSTIAIDPVTKINKDNMMQEWTVTDLKNKLRVLGLKVSGRKEELIERYLTSVASTTRTATTTAATTAATEIGVDDFNNDDDEGWKKDDKRSANARDSDGENEELYIPPDFSIVGEDDEVYEPFDFDKDMKLAESKRPARRTISSNDPYDENENDSRQQQVASSNRRVIRPGRLSQGSTWMQRNAAFSNADENDTTSNSYGKGYELNDATTGNRPNDPNQQDRGNRRTRTSRNDSSSSSSNASRTFREDFRGTRVFVQGLPPTATWQQIKDHFRIAGEVVFASVSADAITGQSKGHGIVQYETTEMAQTAIAIMRNHPLDGYQLFVREDYQESDHPKEFSSKMPNVAKGPTPPTKWKCANEENASYLSEPELMSIRSLIKSRDFARRKKEYDVSDEIRNRLKEEHGVQIDDRLKMWWVMADGNQVPQAIKDIKGNGRWGDPKPWRQIPTTLENDACVNPDLVMGLLQQRDIARKEKDFTTADALLREAVESPDGDLYLRIHDESRTWRIWTDEAPPPPPASAKRSRWDANSRNEERLSSQQTTRNRTMQGKSPSEQCIDILKEHDPAKMEEIRNLLSTFPGREKDILKKLQQRYL